MSLEIKSSTFKEGEVIPKIYTGEGNDLSPPLQWSVAPPGTQSLSLICDDPDAPTPEPWVHWVIYDISPSITALPEGITQQERIQNPSLLQGKNSWGRLGYGGPMPPVGHGWHRYFFKLFALDSKLKLEPGASKAELLEAMKGHLLAEGQLMGKYKRG